MTLSPTLSRVLAWALLAAVIAGSLGWVAVPMWRMYQSNAETIEDQQQSIAKFRRTGVALTVTHEQLQSLEQQHNTNPDLLHYASATLAAAALQKRVRESVQRSAGQLLSTDVLPDSEPEASNRITLRVRLSASTDGLLAILYDLESRSPLLIVDHLSVVNRRGQAANAASTPERLEIQFEISGFLRLTETG